MHMKVFRQLTVLAREGREVGKKKTFMVGKCWRRDAGMGAYGVDINVRQECTRTTQLFLVKTSMNGAMKVKYGRTLRRE